MSARCSGWSLGVIYARGGLVHSRTISLVGIDRNYNTLILLPNKLLDFHKRLWYNIIMKILNTHTVCYIKCHCLKCDNEYSCHAVHLNGKHDGDYLCNKCTDNFLDWVGTLSGKNRLVASAKKWIIADMGRKGGSKSTAAKKQAAIDREARKRELKKD